MLALTERSSAIVRHFKTLSSEQLNFKRDPEQWSVLECIEHLNLYGDFYLPEIERRIMAATKGGNTKNFNSGMIGDYFANLMKAKDGKVKKMKSPKDKNPANSLLPVTTLDRFLKQQDRLKVLLEQSSKVDLTSTKCSISISKLIKLRLGDTFRFLVYHIERHVAQAERAIASI